MRADVCFSREGGWRVLLVSGVLLVGAVGAQAQSLPGTVVPTLGQLSDAQARKAREEWMKTKTAETAEPASPVVLASASTAAAPLGPLPKRELVYAVEGIYGQAGDLQAELSMSGITQTVRAGERLGGGWVVQAIAHDEVTMVRETQADMPQTLMPTRKRKK